MQNNLTVLLKHSWQFKFTGFQLWKKYSRSCGWKLCHAELLRPISASSKCWTPIGNTLLFFSSMQDLLTSFCIRGESSVCVKGHGFCSSPALAMEKCPKTKQIMESYLYPLVLHRGLLQGTCSFNCIIKVQVLALGGVGALLFCTVSSKDS